MSFTVVPEAAPGGAGRLAAIAGKVTHAPRDSYVLLFAHSNLWWVQPDVRAEHIVVRADGTWQSTTHLGVEYAAVLIVGKYTAPEHSSNLPEVNGAVRALAVVVGRPAALLREDHGVATLRFSGYEWSNSSELGQLDNQRRFYLSQNAAVDSTGALHLRIRTMDGFHTCAQVHLAQTLGYGTLRFTVAMPPDLDPAAEFTFFFARPDAREGFRREVEMNLSRWGDPRSQNAEYVVEPYFISANVHRFELQPGEVTSTLKWSPKRLDFASARVGRQENITHWTYNASVPVSRDERVFLNFCPFAYPLQPFKRDAEIVLRQFEFVP